MKSYTSVSQILLSLCYPRGEKFLGIRNGKINSYTFKSKAPSAVGNESWQLKFSDDTNSTNKEIESEVKVISD